MLFLKESLQIPYFGDIQQYKQFYHDHNVLKPLNFAKLPRLKTINSSNTSTSSLNKLVIDDNFNINKITNDQLLNLIPLNKDFGHTYTHKICRFCFYNGLTFDHFYNWYKQKNDDENNNIKWLIHWDNMPNFPKYDISNVQSILIFYYPDITRNKHFINFVNLLRIDHLILTLKILNISKIIIFIIY